MIAKEPTADELAAELNGIFPGFTVVRDDQNDVGFFSLHSIMADFAVWAGMNLLSASDAQLEVLGQWLDASVAFGDAVSTFLLEHAHQLGLEKLLRPHINAATFRAMRP